MSDSNYFDIRPKSNSDKWRMAGHKRHAPMPPSKSLVCHYCGHEWQGKIFICVRCHTPYDPHGKFIEKPPEGMIGLALELYNGRRRQNLTRRQAAEAIGCSYMTVRNLETGRSKVPASKIMRERMRIWIESTKPAIDRRNEIDSMFKENVNG